MPIDLRKYDRKYVEILIGSTKVFGLLIGNTLFDVVDFHEVKHLSDYTYWLWHTSAPKLITYEVDGCNLGAIRDITDNVRRELLHSLNEQPTWLEQFEALKGAQIGVL